MLRNEELGSVVSFRHVGLLPIQKRPIRLITCALKASTFMLRET